MRNYIDLSTIYEDDVFGELSIYNQTNKFLASQKIKNFYNVTNEYENFSDFYLTKNGKLIMCSTEFELLTNTPFLENAKGDVLILGLGLGMVVFPLLNDTTISSIKIVENDLEIIQYIGNKISELDLENKVTIVSGDAYNYHMEINSDEKYDTIFLDFWIELNKDNIEELTTIKENYRPFLKDQNSTLISWCEDIKHFLIKSFGG